MLFRSSIIKVTRIQPPLISNFAMTDYGSQGRTHPNNVVHLSNCRNHQEYYTALSRSSHSSGTVIIGNINTNLITGGISGWLRQEFRDLKILDDITTRSFEQNLHPRVQGSTWYTTITAFRSIYGTNYVQKHTHHALRWSTHDYHIPSDPKNTRWTILDKKNLPKLQ